MVIVLSSTDAPRLIDLDRLDRLHAEVHGDVESARLDPLCRPGDDGHVWLDIARARHRGEEASADPEFGRRFDAMIEFAATHGWLDDAGTHVRAHIQSSG